MGVMDAKGEAEPSTWQHGISIRLYKYGVGADILDE